MVYQKTVISALVISCATWLSSSSLTAQQTDAKKEPASQPSLEGNWSVESAVVEGNAFPPDVLKMMSLSMRAGRYQARVGDNVDRGSYKINNDKKPHWIDVTGVEGANKGKTFLCIYDWQDEKLRICYSLIPERRPTTIDAKPAGQMVIIYTRRKP